MNEVARALGDLQRRIEVLERAGSSREQPALMGAVTGLLRDTRFLMGSSAATYGQLAGTVPAGEPIRPWLGNAQVLTDASGRFTIETPFPNALVSIVAISSSTDVFAGDIGIYSATNKLSGLHAPIMRCHVGGSPTGSAFVRVTWIALGA